MENNTQDVVDKFRLRV